MESAEAVAPPKPLDGWLKRAPDVHWLRRLTRDRYLRSTFCDQHNPAVVACDSRPPGQTPLLSLVLCTPYPAGSESLRDFYNICLSLALCESDRPTLRLGTFCDAHADGFGFPTRSFKYTRPFQDSFAIQIDGALIFKHPPGSLVPSDGPSSNTRFRPAPRNARASRPPGHDDGCQHFIDLMFGTVFGRDSGGCYPGDFLWHSPPDIFLQHTTEWSIPRGTRRGDRGTKGAKQWQQKKTPQSQRQRIQRTAAQQGILYRLSSGDNVNFRNMKRAHALMN